MISISQIRAFKTCRRAYELHYIHGVIPVDKPDALKVGAGYHERIEALYNNEPIENDYSKESAMAEAYKKYIYPYLPIAQVEQWIKNDKYIGRIDGITADGKLVEHKTTSGEIGDEYEYNLQWDEQIPMYMLMTGSRMMYYTVIRKPTIRQKQNETAEEYWQRCVDWYDVDTDQKIRYFIVTRTDEEIYQFERELRRLTFEIEHTSCYYRNPSWCNVYGRKCDYAPICMNYDPNQSYIGFIKKEREECEDADSEI